MSDDDNDEEQIQEKTERIISFEDLSELKVNESVDKKEFDAAVDFAISESEGYKSESDQDLSGSYFSNKYGKAVYMCNSKNYDFFKKKEYKMLYYDEFPVSFDGFGIYKYADESGTNKTELVVLLGTVDVKSKPSINKEKKKVSRDKSYAINMDAWPIILSELSSGTINLRVVEYEFDEEKNDPNKPDDQKTQIKRVKDTAIVLEIGDRIFHSSSFKLSPNNPKFPENATDVLHIREILGKMKIKLDIPGEESLIDSFNVIPTFDIQQDWRILNPPFKIECSYCGGKVIAIRDGQFVCANCWFVPGGYETEDKKVVFSDVLKDVELETQKSNPEPAPENIEPENISPDKVEPERLGALNPPKIDGYGKFCMNCRIFYASKQKKKCEKCKGRLGRRKKPPKKCIVW